MSMLAEPRRKQKWSVDPRNSAWSKDESKFGQKMLERMGWSKGKGLGRTEQGSTEHIKVKVKNNNLGLGTTTSHEDNWIAHQDDFNQLLSELNNHHGQNNTNEPPPEEKQSFSLEEKSKTSKKRVHYMKFTKGKDLSCRSKTDLNCIFGKRAKRATEQEEENNSGDSQGEKEENFTPAASELDTESITKTVTSSLTMQEYFARRMAQLKGTRGQAQDPASSLGAETSEIPGPCERPEATHSTSGNTGEPKKKKKKKKSRKAADETAVAAEKCDAPVIVEENENQEQSRSGGKKKKRKRAEKEGAVKEHCSTTYSVEQNSEEEQPPSKKKKHKKRDDEAELLNGHSPIENQTVEAEVVHKKKKRREQVDSVIAEDKEVLIEKKSKKEKKKRKVQE
ncbi:PIN2/TERF1-interacting telomerase inhibitor 1 [Diretmus argenteus]